MTVETIKKISASIHVGKAKDMPREELCLEIFIGDEAERSPIVQMTKKGSFNHTFNRDMEIGQLLTIRVIRVLEDSVHSTLELTYEELIATSGKRTYDFMNQEQRAGSAELDITVMALVHSGVLDSSIDFLASPLPWFLKAEDIYNLAKRGLARAHELPYTDGVVNSIESLTEALLQRTALIHPEEGSTCLTALDELVSTTLATADDRVDNGRMKVLESVRGLITAVERNATEQRDKIQTIASDLQSNVKSRVSTTVTMTKEKFMTTLALYEESYPTLAEKAKQAITRAHAMATEAHHLIGSYTNCVTELYSNTRNTVNQACTTTHETVQRYYDATVGAAYNTVTETVIKAPTIACKTLDQSSELVKDVPLVGAFAAPCINTAAGVIRYFTNGVSDSIDE